MKKFINYLEKIKEQKKLTKIQLYLSAFGILIFLTILITLPIINNQSNKTQKITNAQAAGNTKKNAPTVTLSANPTSINTGQSSLLTWSSTKATSCTGTNFSTANATRGTTTVSPTATTSYGILCTGPGGTATKSVTVIVNTLSACLNIINYGAISGGPDASTVIQNAISAAQNTQAKCVYVPPGIFQISNFNLDGPVKLMGDGDTSILHAPDNASRQIRVRGSGAGVYNLKLTAAWGPGNYNDQGIAIDGAATNWTIDHVTIIGGHSTGIITFGGSYGRITNNRIADTMAPIHLSGGANHIYVAGNTIAGSSDDPIAVVTYQYQPVVSNEILIENNTTANNITGGRGVAIVGGENVTVRANSIKNPGVTGIYVTSESSWATKGDKNVLVEGNAVDGAPQWTWTGMPSVLLYTDTDYYVEDVLLKNNVITHSPTNSAFRIDASNHLRNIYCIGNTYNGGPSTPQNCAASDPGTITGTVVTSSLLGGTTAARPAEISPQFPLNGLPWELPVTIEAEQYDLGYEGAAYHDADTDNLGDYNRISQKTLVTHDKISNDGNDFIEGVDVISLTNGGHAVSYIQPNEWLEYTVHVATAGTYNLTLHTAAAINSAALRLEADGSDLTGLISLPSTGSTSVYKDTVRSGVQLSAGDHVLRIYVLSGGFNFDWFKLN